MDVYVAYNDPERYAQLAEANQSSVVEWCWATGCMFKGRPFEKERFGNNARWLKEGQPLKPGQLRHGLDAEGRILTIRNPWFNGQYDEDRVTETQLSYEEGRVTYIETPPCRRGEDRTATSVRRFLDESGRLASFEIFGHGHGAVESYFWREDRLEKSISCVWHHDSVGSVSYIQETYEYDDRRRLNQIWEQYLNADGTPLDEFRKKLIYRRPAEGETIPALSAAIEAMLLDQIPKALMEARIEATVYCLLLCYCGEDFEAAWPPFLVLGNEKNRQAIIAAGSDVQYYLWAPDEMRENSDTAVVDLRDESLIDRCSLHAQLMGIKNSFAAGRKVLKNVAQRLNEFHWDGILATTADFIVAFADNTGERSVDKDIRASISERRFADLRSRRLL
jgi:hypothetical protein